MRGLNPYASGRIQSRLWTPKLLQAEGAAWFDAGDLSTCDFNAGTYSNIADRWGRAPYMQNGSATTAPSFVSNGIGGKPTARFDKANGLLMEYYSATVVMSNAFIVAIVGSINAVGSNARLLAYIRAAGGNDFDNSGSMALLYRSAANTLTTYQNGGSRASTTIVDGRVMLFVVTSDGTTCRHYLNGAAGGSGAWGTISLGTGQFGVGVSNSGAGTTGYQGDYATMVAVRGYSPRLHRLIEGAAAWERGLQGRLTAGHPFRNRPPLIGD